LSDADLILVGGGLANTLIALKLADTHPNLKVLLLEKSPDIGGNHTWSFHGTDLSATQLAWLQPLICYNWVNYSVRFPGRKRTLPGSYHSITSERLAEIAAERVGNSIRTCTSVKRIEPTSIILEDGTKLTANAVIDGRGPTASPHLDVRFQKFVGQVVELETNHELTSPVIMDALIDQDDGYRFFYTLPFTPNTVLIEDTHYSDGSAISSTEYGAEIDRYAASQGWRIKQVLREEEGVLPITLGGNLDAFWDDGAGSAVARSGLAAALFHPATGYSLPNAMRLADKLAALQDFSTTTVYKLTRNESRGLWNQTGFYRALNRMLFLAANPRERRSILERFYGLNDSLIARFYAGQNTLADKLRILTGKPPVPIRPAFKSVFRYQLPKNGN